MLSFSFSISPFNEHSGLISSRIDSQELSLAPQFKMESLGLQGDQLILKEINPEYSLEGLVLKLNLQYFGHLMLRADSLEKTLMLGKIEDRRRG